MFVVVGAVHRHHVSASRVRSYDQVRVYIGQLGPVDEWRRPLLPSGYRKAKRRGRADRLWVGHVVVSSFFARKDERH